LNTDVAASFAAIVWLVIEWTVQTPPNSVGLMTGAVAGLATITPAAGYVIHYPRRPSLGLRRAAVWLILAVHLEKQARLG
jgi:Amt family ammonium transporter